MKIAPISWLAQHDIDGAQEVVNFSDWNGALTAEEMQHAINGNMPPLQYTLLHPNAKLTDAEKQTLVRRVPGLSGRQQRRRFDAVADADAVGHELRRRRHRDHQLALRPCHSADAPCSSAPRAPPTRRPSSTP